MNHEELKITDFEEIYLKENRFSQPKENFKLILKERKKDLSPLQSVLDVGCATGEFSYFLERELLHLKRNDGMDILPKLLEVAKTYVPSGNFYIGDITQKDFFFPKKYDWVTNIGVLAVVNNWKIVLRNLWSLLNPGGAVYVFSVFNEEPVDVEVKFRKQGEEGAWEFRNTPSMKSIETYLEKCGKRYEWTHFEMPFAIQKRSDAPMRSWTEPFRGNPYFLFQGNGQITTQKILKIKENSKGL